MTHSQAFGQTQNESKYGTTERLGAWGMLPGPQHFRRVEGRAGALRWD
jgi:hypothetical protein